MDHSVVHHCARILCHHDSAAFSCRHTCCAAGPLNPGDSATSWPHPGYIFARALASTWAVPDQILVRSAPQSACDLRISPAQTWRRPRLHHREPGEDLDEMCLPPNSAVSNVGGYSPGSLGKPAARRGVGSRQFATAPLLRGGVQRVCPVTSQRPKAPLRRFRLILPGIAFAELLY